MLIAIASGKGGVGKSLISIALSTLLARGGKRVVLIDLDLGSGNLHTYLGLPYGIPTIADFLLRRTDSLKEVVVDTDVENLRFVSGSESIPGMANPLYGTKLKLMRHLRALEGDFVVMDLSPGTNLNTIDLFNLADRGIIVTTPEAGAVINAYAFIKGSLFRRVERVFRRHPGMGPILSAQRRGESEGPPDLEWISKKVKEVDPGAYPLIEEIKDSWNVSLVVNMVRRNSNLTLINNLTHLTRERLGVGLRRLGDLPYVEGMEAFLGRVPALLTSERGKDFSSSLESIKGGMLNGDGGGEGMDEETLLHISRVVEGLDREFTETEKRLLKLRLYFKPREVIRSLLQRGVKVEAFLSRLQGASGG